MSEWIDGPPPTDSQGNFPAGVVLDVINGEHLLVGHINELGGVCNDCPCELEPSDIARHKVVWTP